MFHIKCKIWLRHTDGCGTRYTTFCRFKTSFSFTIHHALYKNCLGNTYNYFLLFIHVRRKTLFLTNDFKDNITLEKNYQGNIVIFQKNCLILFKVQTGVRTTQRSHYTWEGSRALKVRGREGSCPGRHLKEVIFELIVC